MLNRLTCSVLLCLQVLMVWLSAYYSCLVEKLWKYMIIWFLKLNSIFKKSRLLETFLNSETVCIFCSYNTPALDFMHVVIIELEIKYLVIIIIIMIITDKCIITVMSTLTTLTTNLHKTLIIAFSLKSQEAEIEEFGWGQRGKWDC